ncbi:unnamed protein product [Rotaria sp. Silwood1]|nr:unnamed protein product [Rotaria sp. Silwood1]CAF1642341.1 unnamed protein product [Rotaria sp. Silwood1]CAF4817270.1 unnamed protein product [Rotaria sp. Silwood1]
MTQIIGSRSLRRKRSNAKTTTSKNKKIKTISSTPLIMDDADKSGLIVYIDYGLEGNSFLRDIDVLHHPSATILAELLNDQQANYFSNLDQNNPNDLEQRLSTYTKTLVKRLKYEAWCLGYHFIEKCFTSEKKRIFKIVPPNEIYLDHDHQCAIDLQPFLPPDEPELTKLYEKFGALWLSKCVKRTLVHKGNIAVSDRGNKLRDLIQYRLDMLFVNNRSNNSSSCALEYDKNKVVLYVQKHIRAFDYIDIASELARFVFKKPFDTVAHTIGDKLASPLQTLKRRGIPIDRLLRHKKQYIHSTIQMIEQKPILNHNNNHYYHETDVKINGHVKDFSRQQIKNDTKLFSMLNIGRAYTQTKFIQQEYVNNEIAHSCEIVPSVNMTRYKDLFYSIPLYIELNVLITNKMLDQATQLAWILRGLASHVFKISIETLRLYRDIDGARIAFNNCHVLFFNLRYYEQVFADEVQPYLQATSSSIPIIHRIVNFYFILTCHELAHNFEAVHNSKFIHHLETIAVKFMPEKDLFLQKFSFQNYLQHNFV